MRYNLFHGVYSMFRSKYRYASSRKSFASVKHPVVHTDFFLTNDSVRSKCQYKIHRPQAVPDASRQVRTYPQASVVLPSHPNPENKHIFPVRYQ